MASLRTVAVFADNGTTAHAALYGEVGEWLARRGALIVVVTDKGSAPAHLVAGALRAGGEVLMIGREDDAIKAPLEGARIERVQTRAEALAMAARDAQALIGLPGRLDSAADLHAAWISAGGAASGKPVGLLNRKRAFEVVRGFIGDVASVGLGRGTDDLVQFSDTIEDLWTRLSRLKG
ncbi:hypothetical protein [Pelagibacterium montanilacus]|uniref:hypothetical protein n=1 Tax=Pelagibacterium montanilacus TaxID=2185280 RepID=UPI000F8C3D12|nr:hypothetical protein [Pelagibacterium montanilacus]